jgi:peptide/nickel transport system substrate-binding protein
VDTLLTEARSTLDQNRRLVLYKQLDGILYHDVPTVSLFQSVNLWAASTNVHGFVAPPDDRLELLNVSLS